MEIEGILGSDKNLMQQSCSPSPCLFIIVLAVLAKAIRQQKDIQWIQIGKEGVKLLLSLDDMMVYISDQNNYARELLQLTNTFSNVAGYKINSKS